VKNETQTLAFAIAYDGKPCAAEVFRTRDQAERYQHRDMHAHINGTIVPVVIKIIAK